MTPYQEGQRAHDFGLDLEDNPYDELTELTRFELWEEGWLDQAQEESDS